MLLPDVALMPDQDGVQPLLILTIRIFADQRTQIDSISIRALVMSRRSSSATIVSAPYRPRLWQVRSDVTVSSVTLPICRVVRGIC